MVSYLLGSILKVSCDEVAIHLVEKEEISRLHEIYFGDPSPTDCISFPIDEPLRLGRRFPSAPEPRSPILLGEIFVCPEVACEWAKKHNKNCYAETALYIIHGLLHLLGYDDVDSADRLQMQRKQQRCLKRLAQDDWIQRLQPCLSIT